MGEVVEITKSSNVMALENAVEFAGMVNDGMEVSGSVIAWVGEDGLVYWKADEGTPEDAVNSMASVIMTVTAWQLCGGQGDAEDE